MTAVQYLFYYISRMYNSYSPRHKLRAPTDRVILHSIMASQRDHQRTECCSVQENALIV
jgi:hypothetical protein